MRPRQGRSETASIEDCVTYVPAPSDTEKIPGQVIAALRSHEGGDDAAGNRSRSVRHRVDDVVDSQLEGEIGILPRIFFHLGPLPGIAQVNVVVDHHHLPAGVVLNAPIVSLISSLFPGSSTVDKLEPRNLDEFPNVVVTVKDRMTQGKVYGLILGKDHFHL